MNKRWTFLPGVLLGLLAHGAWAASSGTAFNPQLELLTGCTSISPPPGTAYGPNQVVGELPTELVVGQLIWDVWCVLDYTQPFGVGVGPGDHFGATGVNLPHLMNAQGDYIPYRVANVVGGATVGDVGIGAIDPAYPETPGAAPSLVWYSGGISAVHFDLSLVLDHLPVGTYTDTVQVVLAWP